MKLFLFFLLITSLNICAIHAQTQDDNKIYTSAEKGAEFPGGMNNFYSYLNKNVHYSGNAHGRVILQFIIEKDGTIDSIKVVRGVSKQADKETARVLSKSPKWMPAMVGDKVVRQQYAIPISWGLSN